MSDYDEFIDDVGADRIEVQIGDSTEHTAEAVTLDLSFGGQHIVVVPFAVPGDFSIEVALFDVEGVRVGHRLMSILSPDSPFVTNEQP